MNLDLKQYAFEIRVTDGVYGTELQNKGLAAGGCPELMNAENPEVVRTIARSFVEAGSDVIMTNTLGANRFMLKAYKGRHGTAAIGSARAREPADSRLWLGGPDRPS